MGIVQARRLDVPITTKGIDLSSSLRRIKYSSEYVMCIRCMKRPHGVMDQPKYFKLVLCIN